MIKLHLIDKDVMIQRLIATYLKGRNITLEVMTDFSELTRTMGQAQNNHMLAAIDFKEKADNGKPAYTQFRSQYPQIPVILIVGSIYDSELKEAKKDPMTYVLRKPFTGKLLLDALNKSVQRIATKTMAEQRKGQDTLQAAGAKDQNSELPGEKTRMWDTVIAGTISLRKEAMSILQDQSGLPSTDDGADIITEVAPQFDPRISPIRSALVVDRDRATANLINNYLAKRGVMDVELCKKGKKAWECAQNSNYDLIVIEWEVDDLTGLALYNRIRALPSHRFTPIIVLTGSMRKGDFRVLEESPFTYFTEKPLQAHTFNKAINRVVANFMSLKKSSRAIGKMLQEASACQGLNYVIDQLVAKMPDTNILCRFVASYLIENNRIKEAERMLLKMLEKDDKDVHHITQLAKVYHLRKKPDEAYALLSICQDLSPQNIERLCLMSDSAIQGNQPEVAKNHLEEALIIDSESEKVQHKLDIANGLLAYVEEKKLDTYGYNCASILNVMGVSYAKKNMLTVASSYYQSAIGVIPDDVTILAKLHFNLGLCYLRAKDRPKSLQQMELAHKYMNGDYAKAAKYIAALKDDGIDLDGSDDGFNALGGDDVFDEL